MLREQGYTAGYYETRRGKRWVFMLEPREGGSQVTHKRNVPTRDIGDKVHNWWSADTFLGRRNQRKLANNTVIYRDPIEPDAIRVKLHYTVIVTYFRDGRIQINSGGHRTKTTKQRLNQLLPHGVGIHQKNFDWYVSAGDSTVPFRDGMILTPFGEQWTPAGQRYAINPHRRNPGKFNNELDEAVWSAMMDQSWVNEQESADGLGWIGVSYGMTLQELAEQGHGDLEELAFVARRDRIPMQRDGTFFAVAYEGDSGFVYVSYHESEQEALDFFYRDVAETFGDDPDEYDEFDEPEHEDLT